MLYGLFFRRTNEPSDSLAKPATTSRDPSNDLTKLSSSNATIQQTPTDSENTPPSTCEFKVPEPADQIRETKSKCNIPAPHVPVPNSTTTTTPASFDPASLQTELEDLLGAQSSREKESKRVQEEILTLLNTPSSKVSDLSLFRTLAKKNQLYCLFLEFSLVLFLHVIIGKFKIVNGWSLSCMAIKCGYLRVYVCMSVCLFFEDLILFSFEMKYIIK